MFTSKNISQIIQKLRNSTLTRSIKRGKIASIEIFVTWLKNKKLLSEEDYRKIKAQLEKIKNDTDEKVSNSNILGSIKPKIIDIVHINTFKSLALVTLLLIALIFFFIGFKELFFPQKKRPAYQSASYGRYLRYAGKLTDQSGNPIDYKTDLTFKLYSSEKAGAPVYTGACLGEQAVTPDYKGDFSLLLGSDCEMKAIPEEIFFRFQNLYLAITVGEDSEMQPRQKIAQVGYALQADKIKGLTLGTKTNSIPYIDGNGQLLIEAASPTILSQSGEFTLEGQSLNLKTSADSEGSIYISPDKDTIITTGNLGIGTYQPTVKLDVAGSASISGSLGIGTLDPNFGLTINKNAPYSSGASITNSSDLDNSQTGALRLNLATSIYGTTSRFIQFFAGNTTDHNTNNGLVGQIRLNNGQVAYETNGADFAEYLSVAEAVQDGDIISFRDQKNYKSRVHDPVIGVVSRSAGFIGNLAQKQNTGVVVGLLGQIFTNVSNINGTIQIGDLLSPSEIPGHGAKSNSSDEIVGRSLADTSTLAIDEFNNSLCPEEFRQKTDPQGKPVKCGKIIVFVRPAWALSGDIETSSTHDVKSGLVESVNVVVQNMLTASKIIAGYIQAAVVEADQITVKQISGLGARFSSLDTEKLTSPIIETEKIQTRTLTAQEIRTETDTITLDLKKQNHDQTAQNKFAQLIIKGLDDAPVASIDAQGNASFSGQLTSSTASVSGELYAGEIRSETINKIQNSVDTVRSYVDSSRSDLQQNNKDLLKAIQQINQELQKLASQPLPNVEYYQKLQADQLSSIPMIDELNVQSKLSAYNLNVTNQLTTGNLILQDNQLLSLDWELKLSALSQINFLDSAVIITKDGSLTASGEIIAKGGVQTTSISALNKDIDLKVGSASEEGKLRFIDTQGGETASISNQGTGSFRKLALETAGIGTIPQNSDQVIVYNSNITANSLIYLTPTTANSQNLAVVEKENCDNAESSCKAYFRVISEKKDNQSVRFNWLIVN